MAFEHFGLCLFTFDNCHFKLEETFLHCLPQRWSFGCCSFLNLLFDAQSSQVSFTDIFTALLGRPLSEPLLSQEYIHSWELQSSWTCLAQRYSGCCRGSAFGRHWPFILFWHLLSKESTYNTDPCLVCSVSFHILSLIIWMWFYQPSHYLCLAQC